MISIIITAYKEFKTIGKCIKSIASQKIKEPYELLVVAPDKETLDSAKKASKKAITLKDDALGKWNALNMCFKRAKGRILILCDGDTYLAKNSINPIIDVFNNEEAGIASGRVISTNKDDNLMGYWSQLLANATHEERIKRRKNKGFIDCSGYLLGLRAGIIKELPPNLLTEDTYISHYVWDKGFDTEYVPESKVYVKFPTNLSDWIKQKRRNSGGCLQLKKQFKKTPIMRSFLSESLKGPIYVIKYPKKNLKEMCWSLFLFPARLWLWVLAFYDRIAKKEFKDVWKRIESTK